MEKFCCKTSPMNNYNLLRLAKKQINYNSIPMKKLLLLTILILGFSCLYAQTIYVKPNANGSGSSWADASGDLALMLNTATLGIQIWVAAGTYYPTQCTSCGFTERDISFVVKDGVKLYGGFQGNESNLEQRNYLQNPTILSGDIDRNATSTNNSFSIIYTKNVSTAAVVDGFIIQEGNADSPDADPGTKYTSGGGWYNDGVLENGFSSPTISNCIFSSNRAIAYGAGMYNNGSFSGEVSPIYNNCRFSNNTATLGGGGLYNNGVFGGKANPNLVDCDFSNNKVTDGHGGGMFNRGAEEGQSNPLMVNCNFTSNEAAFKGGGVYNEGGNNGQSNAEFLGCNFNENDAEHGGGIYNDGGFSGESSPSFSGCNFKLNSALQSGGGIYNDGVFEGESSPVFEGCFIQDNEAEGDGGGVFSSGLENGQSHAIYTNTFFINNSSNNNGGGLCHFGKGGSVNPEFIDCGFSANDAVNGGAMYNDGSFLGESSPSITNCNFDNNTSSVDGAGIYNFSFEGGESNPILTHCKFRNNHSTFAGAAIFNNGITGNSSPMIANCEFLSNVADTYGGAIYNQGKSGRSSPQIINCLFSKNKGSSAGAIYNLGAENGNSSPSVTNCTFYSNRALVGGGIYSNASDETGTSSPVITNCIFYKNTADLGDIFRIIQGTPMIQHCLVDKNNCDELYSGIEGSITCGAGVIFNQNPMFADTAAGNFHLLAESPVIDEGNNSVIQAADIMMDLDDQPRIQNGTVDFGVYEFMESTSNNTLTITQQPSGVELCEGEDIIIEVSASSDASITYQWQRNGDDLVNANQSILTVPAAVPAVSGTYTVVLSAGTETVTSEPISVQVHPNVAVSIEILSNTTTLCGGEAINFWAEIAGGGSNPSYEWRVDGTLVGENSATFSPTNLTDGATVTATLISSENCSLNNAVVSNDITVSVGNGIMASVQISSTETQICKGEMVSFVADPINEGTTPTYQWLLNDNPVGENSNTFTSTLLDDGDMVTCRMTSSESCVVENVVTSNGILMSVANSLEPSLLISTDSFYVCQNTPVIFSTLAVNAGDNVVFDWRVNGISTGDSDSFLHINTLEDGDEVTCQMTSSISCATVNPVLSNPLTIGVNPDCVFTSIGNVEEDIAFDVFPNPTNGQFMVQIPTDLSGSEMTMTDVQGRVITRVYLQEEYNSIVVHPVPGIYFVRLVKDNQMGVRKLVVF